MSRRTEFVRVFYEGCLADPGERNPYAGESLLLARLWMSGYMRMLRVRIETGPAMRRYRAARALSISGRISSDCVNSRRGPVESHRPGARKARSKPGLVCANCGARYRD
jgi:hypothetical protein